jgi:hypothetical protein
MLSLNERHRTGLSNTRAAPIQASSPLLRFSVSRARLRQSVHYRAFAACQPRRRCSWPYLQALIAGECPVRSERLDGCPMRANVQDWAAFGRVEHRAWGEASGAPLN